MWSTWPTTRPSFALISVTLAMRYHSTVELTDRQIVIVRNVMLAVTIPVYFWIFTVMDESLFSWWTLLVNAALSYVVAAYVTVWLCPMIIEGLEKILQRRTAPASRARAGDHAVDSSAFLPAPRVLPPARRTANREYL